MSDYISSLFSCASFSTSSADSLPTPITVVRAWAEIQLEKLALSADKLRTEWWTEMPVSFEIGSHFIATREGKIFL